MKKLCFLFSLLFLLSCVGCQSQQSSGKKARTPDSYLAEAEHYLETGDTETAIKVLEEGIEKTGDESLSAKLAELKPEEAAAPTNCPQCETELAEGVKFCPECGADTTAKAALTNCPDCDAELKDGAKFCPDCGKDLTAAEEAAQTQEDPSAETTAEEKPKDTSITIYDMKSYAGAWSSKGACYGSGGLVLDITVNTNNVAFDVNYVSSPPSCRVAQLTKTIAASELKNPLSFRFEDDGWGNSGTITLNFLGNSIDMEVSDVQTNPDAWWGFSSNTTYQLFPNPDIHESMAEPAPQVHSLEEAKEIIYADLDKQIDKLASGDIFWSEEGQYIYIVLVNNTGFTYQLNLNVTFYTGTSVDGTDQINCTIDNGYSYNLPMRHYYETSTNYESSYTVSNIYENGVYLGS